MHRHESIADACVPCWKNGYRNCGGDDGDGALATAAAARCSADASRYSMEIAGPGSFKKRSSVARMLSASATMRSICRAVRCGYRYR